jgi:hypothetical protein
MNNNGNHAGGGGFISPSSSFSTHGTSYSGNTLNNHHSTPSRPNHHPHPKPPINPHPPRRGVDYSRIGGAGYYGNSGYPYGYSFYEYPIYYPSYLYGYTIMDDPYIIAETDNINVYVSQEPQ